MNNSPEMIPLNPDPQRNRRLIACAIHVTAVLIAPAGWWIKLLALPLGAFLLGTYRQAWISEERFLRQFVFMFVPQQMMSWPLDRFQSIETRQAKDPGSESSLFGSQDWFIFQVFDWLVPWRFGKLRLRLRLENGKRVLVWQGMSDENYEENLELLKEHTGLPVAAPDGTVSDEEWRKRQGEVPPE